MRKLLVLAALAVANAHAPAFAAPNVLAWTATADSQCNGAVTPAVTATAGAGAINTTIFLDYDTNIPNIIGELALGSVNIFSIATGLAVNHSPYRFSQYCFGVIGGTYLDASGTLNTGTTLYAAALAANANVASPGLQKGTNSNPQQLQAAAMSVTSPNALDGNQGSGGYGTEFFLSSGYLGLNTSSDSFNIGTLSGIAAAVNLAHASYNAFDVHAVLRQTASNWSTGWNLTNGYGTISYAAASGAIATVFLQAPDVQIQNHGFYAQLTIYAFRTTRRNHEVVYSCTPAYSWPVKNEYTLADVTAGCGTLLYTSNGTDVAPTFTYAPALSGSATFVAFTTDGSGGYSRVDSWVPQAQTFVVGIGCNHP